MYKKLTAFILCLIMTFELIPALPVQAGSTDFVVSNGILTKYNGAGGDVVIPDNLGITSIGEYAFSNCNNLTSIIIPNTVTSIGDGAFSYCFSLTSVTIPNSVTSIGNNAFARCGLTSVIIPNSVTSIGSGVFYYCTSLTSVTISDSITSISNSMFSQCYNLREVTIPNSVTSINAGAFDTCSKLTDVIIPDSVTNICDSAFSNCTSLTSVTIPNSVTSIGNGAFYGCSNLTSLIIGNRVTNIGNGAFRSCSSLMSVTIPASVTNIYEYAFSDCNKLTKIDVLNENTSYSSLEGVLYDKLQTTLICYPSGKTDSTFTVPNSVYSICDNAFSNCSSLTSVTIPNSVTSIGDAAFYNCTSLTSATIPNSVTRIGDEAFYYCRRLNSVSIPNSITSIGYSMFNYCTNLTSVTIPNSVTSIGGMAFYYCTNLTSVIIPNSVTSIGDAAFYNCTSLTSATIPNSVTSIGNTAFGYCTSLTEAKFLGNAPAMGIDEFAFCSPNFKVYYLYGSGFTNPWSGYPTEPFYMVTYDGNISTGGTAPVDNSTYLQGAAVTVLGNTQSLTKTGFTFAGWNTKADGSGTDYVTGATFPMETSNITLYAKWAINNYNVTFNSNGGSAVANQSVNYNAKVSKPEDPTMTGYTFAGWYTDDGTFANLFDFTNTAITGDVTLYAKWTKITALTVKGTVTNGSITGLLASYAYGDTVKLTASPAEGYIFDSWTDKAGNILSTNQTYSFNITDNVELTANFIDRCDINKDGKVNIADLALVSQNYNTRNKEANWNSSFDFNKDGIVDIFDLVACSKRIN